MSYNLKNLDDFISKLERKQNLQGKLPQVAFPVWISLHGKLSGAYYRIIGSSAATAQEPPLKKKLFVGVKEDDYVSK